MSNIDDIYIVTKFNDDHHLSQVGDTLIKNENGYFWNNRINMNVGCYPINRIKLTEAIEALDRVESIHKFIVDRHEVLIDRLADANDEYAQTLQAKWSELKSVLLFIESLYKVKP